jgi:hypothetical protein
MIRLAWNDELDYELYLPELLQGNVFFPDVSLAYVNSITNICPLCTLPVSVLYSCHECQTWSCSACHPVSNHNCLCGICYYNYDCSDFVLCKIFSPLRNYWDFRKIPFFF